MKPARIILANLHATSRPALVVPWLLAQCLARRADAVLLQECTPRHAAWLRRAPGFTLIRLRGEAGEAILARRGAYHEAAVIPDASPGWLGKHTGEQHPGRVIPTALIRGWLRVASIHFPPGWLNGPADRREAGRLYSRKLAMLRGYHITQREARFYGGDWNAKPDEYRGSRNMPTDAPSGLTARVGPDSIDHAEAARCKVSRFKRLGRGPGMDHAAWLYVVEQLQ